MERISTTGWATVVFVSLGLAACGGGGSGGDAASAPSTTTAPIADLTGTWSVTESGVSDCPGLATFNNGPSQITVTQNGNSLSVVTAVATFTGNVSGDHAGWQGSYPSGNGTVTITSMTLVVASDGNTMSGTATWHFADSTGACNGTSQSINAKRVAGGAVPSAPSALSATPRSASSVHLVWNDNAANESGFKVERRVTGGSAGFAQVALTAADATSLLDTGLDALTTYDYRVRATNANGDSAFSNVATVTTLPAPIPAPLAPSNLRLTVDSPSAISLQWTDNSTNETIFKIERSTKADSGFAQVGSVGPNVTSFQDAGLNAATQYFYRVRAGNATGDSAFSNVATATTPPQPVAPSAPTDLRATAVSATRIDITWRDRSDNETGFKIERSTSSNSGFTQVGTTAANVTQFSDTGLNRSTRYFYRVRATNNGLDSNFSNVDDATTPKL